MRSRPSQSGPGWEWAPIKVPLELPHPEVAQRTAQEQKIDDEAVIARAYGTVETPGVIKFTHAVGDEVWIVRALLLGERDATLYGGESSGAIDSLVSIVSEKGDDVRWNPNFEVFFYNGSLTQIADPNIANVVPGGWHETGVITNPVTGKRRAVCYSIERYKGVSTFWTQGLGRHRYRIRASKVLNLETGNVEYTEKLFYHWRDWALDPDGLHLPIDELDHPSFLAAAQLSGYLSHMLMASGNTPDWLQTFRLMGDAFWVRRDGKFSVLVDRDGPAVASYDDRHYAKSRPIAGGAEGTSSAGPINEVSIEFTDTTGPVWKPKTTAPLATDEARAGLVERIPTTYKLPHIHDEAFAIAKLPYLLYTLQDDFRIKPRWLASTGDRNVLDIVTQSVPEKGLVDKFRIISRDKRPDNTYDVVLRRMSPRVYAPATVSTVPRLGSTLPDAAAAPPAVRLATITWAESPVRLATGAVHTRGLLTWVEDPFAFRARTELALALNGSGVYTVIDRDAVTPRPIDDLLKAGTKYSFRLTSYALNGTASASTTYDVTIAGKAVAPLAPLGLLVTARGGAAELTWPKSVESDVVLTEVRCGALTDTFATASYVSRTEGQTFTDYPAVGTHRYFIKFIDAAGTYSSGEAYGDVTIFYYGTAGSMTSLASFDAGTFTNAGTSLAAIAPRGDFVKCGDAMIALDDRDYSGMGTFKARNLIVATGATSGAPLRFYLSNAKTGADIDAEITALGFTSVQQWEDWRATTYAAKAHGMARIPACYPLNLVDPVSGQDAPLSAFILSRRTVSGDKDGMRNCEFRFQFNGATSTPFPSTNDTGLLSTAEPLSKNVRPVTAPSVPGVHYAWSGSVDFSVLGGSPQNFDSGGGGYRLGVKLSTNDAFSQRVLTLAATNNFAITFSQTAVPVYPQTDLTTDANGRVTLTFPQPMRAGQVASPSIEVLNGINANISTVSTSNTAMVIQAWNPATNTPHVGIVLRVSAADVGGGGTTTSTSY